jgi:hypothetical protein
MADPRHHRRRARGDHRHLPVATYNSLVTLNVRVDEAWSDITVQLKRVPT